MYVVCLAISRAAASNVLLVISPSGSFALRSHESRRSVGFGLWFGLCLVPFFIGIGYVTERHYLVFMGTLMPWLLAQDAIRYALMAEGRGWAAARNDLIWFGVALLLLPLAGRDPSASKFVLAWGISGGIACLVGFRQVGRPSGSPLSWMRQHSLILRHLVAAALLQTLVPQLALVILFTSKGSAATGALRGATLLVGPILTVIVGLGMALVGETNRVKDLAPSDLHRLVRRSTAVVTLGATAWCALVLTTPLGATLLGDTWAGARAVLPATCTGAISWASSVGLTAVLIAKRDAKGVMWIRLIELVVALALCALLTPRAGAVGVGWSLATASILTSVLVFIRWLRFSESALREPGRHAPLSRDWKAPSVGLERQ
jgi:hypothetical protein